MNLIEFIHGASDLCIRTITHNLRQTGNIKQFDGSLSKNVVFKRTKNGFGPFMNSYQDGSCQEVPPTWSIRCFEHEVEALQRPIDMLRTQGFVIHSLGKRDGEFHWVATVELFQAVLFVESKLYPSPRAEQAPIEDTERQLLLKVAKRFESNPRFEYVVRNVQKAISQLDSAAS